MKKTQREKQNRKIHKYRTKLCQMNDKPRENYQAHNEHQSQQNESYTNEKIYKRDRDLQLGSDIHPTQKVDLIFV